MDANMKRETANIIWRKLKGRDVPTSYSERDIDAIIDRYWHKAMESEQGDTH